MASTLSISSLALNSLVPPPSQDFAMHQMPDVFVIPPEEELEHNPPWCYFDATQAASQVALDSLSTHPDMEAIDVALSLCQQRDNRAPTFLRSFTNESQETIVMPRRGSTVRLRDMNLDIEEGQTDIRSRGGVRKYDDDEIVEVVKVRRNEGMADVGDLPKVKKSATFRARATQALRSIKLNVGKSQHRISVSEHQPPSELQASTIPTRHSFQGEPLTTLRPKSPSVSRRRSLTLSQFFTFKENQPSRPATPSDELKSLSSPTLVSEYNPSKRPTSPTSERPTSPVDFIASPAPHLHPSQPLTDCVATSSKSPMSAPHLLDAEQPSKPALSKRKSFRRRLSVLEIQKLFTLGGSSSSHTAHPQSYDSDDLFSPSQSRPKSMDIGSMFSARTSTASAPGSATLSDLPSRSSSTLQLDNKGGGEAEDDIEMRLDSLHFDSLHFDPDEIMNLI